MKSLNLLLRWIKKHKLITSLFAFVTISLIFFFAVANSNFNNTNYISDQFIWDIISALFVGAASTIVFWLFGFSWKEIKGSGNYKIKGAKVK